ncbi:hypothetical protein ECHHL_0543 [Ehrlichia chaffeensis str. Heartland]|uniref:Uncharacterized protein n=1 Tax=Ehrlichia chaffeensis (strain ATCC CRL-10679 / Arkansas) TaxID=205920 RepID=Q2GGK4_EHRCR|nr:hypothetical protein [Ehrlichia chaffeensis]ABD45284.1 conserved hypothetical protein [Ehrlichia chaffeensis str. Arkansas]AHX03700.1 hypothetical protein ECHHL_0543 [Ehrlichia chaffeensis str. Heartland]AHX05579.1 hypothetical protein ECHJAX_0514 [Ehrlichia chaffeensis str. Jax]AHX06569.1 hypothetical protein ECHLIB_0515 [Ehrlichia chaffeensis str. Liberty]AHX07528.1 hypothetical protein ECHOSC_0552 [Ehrlichia chaffeensis str. Osceola]
MAKKGAKVAKTASKNNPLQRKKGTAQKMYNGKSVKPVKYINREAGKIFIAGQYDNGDLVQDTTGNPIEWASI